MNPSSQFYIFNLFGNFIRPRERPVWTHELILLMRTLGVEEKTTRSTLARMRQKGWLSTEKIGRQSRYSLTQEGLKILEAGDARIFEEPADQWDGRWHLISYSLPDDRTHLRNRLVKQLRWAGYGNLQRGLWISPLDRSVRLLPSVDALGLGEQLVLFSGAQHMSRLSDRELVSRCWDLERLGEKYCQFLNKFQHLKLEEGGLHVQLEAEEAFQHYFWLSQWYQAFPREDPILPKPLLPEEWIGHRARAFFVTTRQRLAGEMQPYLDQLL